MFSCFLTKPGRQSETYVKRKNRNQLCLATRVTCVVHRILQVYKSNQSQDEKYVQTANSNFHFSFETFKHFPYMNDLSDCNVTDSGQFLDVICEIMIYSKSKGNFKLTSLYIDYSSHILHATSLSCNQLPILVCRKK